MHNSAGHPVQYLQKFHYLKCNICVCWCPSGSRVGLVRGSTQDPAETFLECWPELFKLDSVYERINWRVCITQPKNKTGPAVWEWNLVIRKNIKIVLSWKSFGTGNQYYWKCICIDREKVRNLLHFFNYFFILIIWCVQNQKWNVCWMKDDNHLSNKSQYVGEEEREPTNEKDNEDNHKSLGSVDVIPQWLVPAIISSYLFIYSWGEIVVTMRATCLLVVEVTLHSFYWWFLSLIPSSRCCWTGARELLLIQEMLCTDPVELGEPKTWWM